MKNIKKAAARFIALLGAIAVVASMAQPIFAQKAFLTRIKKIRPDLVEKKLANCHLCHSYDKEKKEEASKDNLNVFGKDIKADPNAKTITGLKDGDEHKFTDDELALFEKAFTAVLEKDSNGDGTTNKAKLEKGINPGAAKK